MPKLELPNCEDPVFRAWCKACGLKPGDRVDTRDARMQLLEQIMEDACYDPEQDREDDYLTRGL